MIERIDTEHNLKSESKSKKDQLSFEEMLEEKVGYGKGQLFSNIPFYLAMFISEWTPITIALIVIGKTV